MKKYIMALDAGTTSARCILFDKSRKIVAMAQREITQHFPAEGYVELPTRSVPSASPISEKPPLCGIKERANPFITPSYGNVAERQMLAKH